MARELQGGGKGSAFYRTAYTCKEHVKCTMFTLSGTEWTSNIIRLEYLLFAALFLLCMRRCYKMKYRPPNLMPPPPPPPRHPSSCTIIIVVSVRAHRLGTLVGGVLHHRDPSAVIYSAGDIRIAAAMGALPGDAGMSGTILIRLNKVKSNRSNGTGDFHAVETEQLFHGRGRGRCW